MIFKALKALEDFRKQDLNALSSTSAQGFMGIFNGFAGKDAEKGDSRDMLPFPSMAKGEGGDTLPFNPATAKLIVKLMRSGDIEGIPASVFRSIPQIENLIK